MRSVGFSIPVFLSEIRLSGAWSYIRRTASNSLPGFLALNSIKALRSPNPMSWVPLATLVIESAPPRHGIEGREVDLLCGVVAPLAAEHEGRLLTLQQKVEHETNIGGLRT